MQANFIYASQFVLALLRGSARIGRLHKLGWSKINLSPGRTFCDFPFTSFWGSGLAQAYAHLLDWFRLQIFQILLSKMNKKNTSEVALRLSLIILKSHFFFKFAIKKAIFF